MWFFFVKPRWALCKNFSLSYLYSTLCFRLTNTIPGGSIRRGGNVDERRFKSFWFCYASYNIGRIDWKSHRLLPDYHKQKTQDFIQLSSPQFSHIWLVVLTVCGSLLRGENSKSLFQWRKSYTIWLRGHCLQGNCCKHWFNHENFCSYSSCYLNGQILCNSSSLEAQRSFNKDENTNSPSTYLVGSCGMLSSNGVYYGKNSEQIWRKIDCAALL